MLWILVLDELEHMFIISVLDYIQFYMKVLERYLNC